MEISIREWFSDSYETRSAKILRLSNLLIPIAVFLQTSLAKIRSNIPICLPSPITTKILTLKICWQGRCVQSKTSNITYRLQSIDRSKNLGLQLKERLIKWGWGLLLKQRVRSKFIKTIALVTKCTVSITCLVEDHIPTTGAEILTMVCQQVYSKRMSNVIFHSVVNMIGLSKL